jgi:hypothetical protein
MNTIPAKDQVLKAIETIRQELHTELLIFPLVLHPELLNESYGGWLLPAEFAGSGAGHKSYDLHRLIEKIEDRLQDVLGHGPGSTVTVDLAPAAKMNGR